MKNNKNIRAHQRYRNAEGKIVPGVTTVTALLGTNKAVLIKWANNLGLQGIDSSKYRDEAADIGTLAHAMVTDKLAGKKTNTDEYSKVQIDKAENAALSFWNWYNNHSVKVHAVEKQMVSEQYQYGGTCDIYATVDGKEEIIDLKTGKGIYSEYFIQVSAYRHLLEEDGHKIDQIRILNIPRTEDETFKDEIKVNTETYFEIFLDLLNVYKLLKKVR